MTRAARPSRITVGTQRISATYNHRFNNQRSSSSDLSNDRKILILTNTFEVNGAAIEASVSDNEIPA